jgi:hypothetical protein
MSGDFTPPRSPVFRFRCHRVIVLVSGAFQVPLTSISGRRRAAGSPRKPSPRRIGIGLAAVLALVPALVLALGSSGVDPVGAATNPSAMPLQEFANDNSGGRLWNAYDQTDGALGPTIAGRPSPVSFGTTEMVFTRSAIGDLSQFANDSAGGRTWNAYDLTSASSGPQIAGDPSAIVVNKTSVFVFARSTSGDLVEFTNDGTGHQLWNAVDVSQGSGGGAVQGDVSVIAVGSALEAFAQGANGDLIQFTGTGSGARSWSESDLSQASGGPSLSASPGAVLYGQSSIHVYGESPSGHLFEFVNDGQGARSWSAYDLSTIAAGPTASGQPSAIVYGPTVHVYVNTAGRLTEYVNDGYGGRLWNSYDLTAISHGPAVTGDPSAAFYTSSVVDIFVQGPGGDLVSYVNDGYGGRLWNSYDLTSASGGPAIGADPAAIINNGAVSVFAAGPSPPAVVQAIVSAVEGQDQNKLAVVENPPGSNCNIYTAYWDRGTTTGCAPGTSAEEWCSDFAQWAWAAAGVDTSGINGWAYTFVDWGLAHTGAWKPGDANDPEPGDAVVWGDVPSGYASHVGIVVGVSQGMIDVVSGNAGPVIDAAGDVDAVWESGYFDPTTSTTSGYPIIGYVSPTGWTGLTTNARPSAVSPAVLRRLIADQDGGK